MTIKDLNELIQSNEVNTIYSANQIFDYMKKNNNCKPMFFDIEDENNLEGEIAREYLQDHEAPHSIRKLYDYFESCGVDDQHLVSLINIVERDMVNHNVQIEDNTQKAINTQKSTDFDLER